MPSRPQVLPLLMVLIGIGCTPPSLQLGAPTWTARRGAASSSQATGADSHPRTEAVVAVRSGRAVQGSTRADSVPRDLVVALLGGGSRPVDLRIGTVAEGLSEAVFRGGRVLGSATIGTSATTVAIMPLSLRVILDTLQARLAAEGWTPPRLPSRPQRGFVSSDPGFLSSGPGQACRNGVHLAVRPRVRAPNETLVVVSQQRFPGSFGPCADSAAAPRDLADQFPIPMLYPPSDAELEARGSGGGGDQWEVSARLIGPTSPESARSHFAMQLREQNWTTTDSAATDEFSIQSFRHTGTDGRRWLGVLSIIAPQGGGGAYVSLRIVRAPQ